ncbi:zinc finger protein [Penicillium sp. IBT 16267x]|nr:zinc finger protein [Penicillium sp. IBT 16267x]
MRAKHDPTLRCLKHAVDFKEHNNNIIQRTALPRTESGYRDKLLILNVRPQAINPPDIQSCHAFMECIKKGTMVGLRKGQPSTRCLGFQATLHRVEERKKH